MQRKEQGIRTMRIRNIFMETVGHVGSKVDVNFQWLTSRGTEDVLRVKFQTQGRNSASSLCSEPRAW